MDIVMIILGLLCAILLFLYLQLKKDCASLYDQLDYTLKEGSSFSLFTKSTDRTMKKIVTKINDLKNEMDKEKHLHIKEEKDIEDMITNISHDIRTPLTSIQGYLEMMQMSDDVKERSRYYEITKNRLEDLESMLDEFFLYTKLQNSDDLYMLEEQEIYPIVCGVLLNYYDLLKLHNLNPEVICKNENIKALVHEDGLRRICMNLVINTIRYGCNPFRVSIETKHDRVCLLFENRIHKDHNVDVEHMFDRFYKGSEARTQKGSGLGLAIVKELCERMQGSVTANVHKDVLSIRVILKR